MPRHEYTATMASVYRITSDTELSNDELEEIVLDLDLGGTTLDEKGNEVDVELYNTTFDVRGN